MFAAGKQLEKTWDEDEAEAERARTEELEELADGVQKADSELCNEGISKPG